MKAQNFGYLPQRTPSAPGMLIKDLVPLGRYPWQGRLSGLARPTRRSLRSHRNDEHRRSRPDGRDASGGERQRVWLAMLVAQDATLPAARHRP
jgi:iron-chelate-transporting ATPase